MEAMKDKDCNIKLYETETEACEVCGMYEFENAWVMQLVFNHVEDLSTR
jgi:RNA polymerase subunit RPABC4/transcription elongation factor Spt4